MSTQHALYPKRDVDRLYLPEKIGGQGLLQIHQVVGGGAQMIILVQVE